MKKLEIIEVGARDGLQNEASVLDMSTRLQFAQKLDEAGLRRIELGAFVSPVWVPQMAGSGKLISKALQWQKKGLFSKATKISALVPNEKGMLGAIESGVKEIAIFAAASETFSQKNTNCSIKESFERFRPVLEIAKKKKIKVRGYLSTCFGCPYEGKISEAKVMKLIYQILEMGVFEISIGDTIGVGSPKMVRSLLKKIDDVPAKSLAMHFHDTRGMAIANVLSSLDFGIYKYDSSLGGLGGCPYAPGASGNVATEDVVYLAESMGLKTGVDLDKLVAINRWMTSKVQHPLPSKVAQAGGRLS